MHPPSLGAHLQTTPEQATCDTTRRQECEAGKKDLTSDPGKTTLQHVFRNKRVAALRLLRDCPDGMKGLDMVKASEQGDRQLGRGLIYVVLENLVERGYVEVDETEQRNTYFITELGLEYLKGYEGVE